MLESIGALYFFGVVISIVLLILVVRFLWIVPTSLQSISSCLWSLCDIYLDDKTSDLDDKISDFEDDLDDDEKNVILY